MQDFTELDTPVDLPAEAPPSAVPPDTPFSGTTPADANKTKRPNGITYDVKQWSQSGNKYWPSSQTAGQLDPGVYRASPHPQLVLVFERVDVKTDSLIELPDSASDELVKEFSTFWERRDRFAARGLLHKRGFLLHGPPGSGKTTTLALMCQRLVKDHGGIVLLAEHPELSVIALQFLRAIEPNRPVVVLMEDIDALTARYGEHSWLALLDGESQIDRVVFVATTNYPERLDDRFINRPSRFDTRKYIGMPAAPARDLFLKTRAPELDDAERAEWVEKTDGMSIAHLRELVIAHYCFDQPADDVIERLRKMATRPNSERSEDAPGFGFFPAGTTKH